MRKSEIFDSFVKIAQEKGLVSKASTTEEAKNILEKTKRADSLSAEDIANLYDVKPDAPVEMQYIRNIIENAHKKPFVISPSYDKLNGLVENVNERQDILLHILHKTPDGLNTQHKYAKKDLLMSLVRVGNDLDNRNQEKLCSLADFCLTQLTDNMMKKEGQVAIFAAAAATLAALYWQQHSDIWSQGFVADSKKLVSEINDLATSGSSSMIYGYQYRPEFIAQMKDFQSKVTELYNMYVQEVLPAINNMDKPQNAKELFVLAKQPGTHAAIKAHHDFAAYAGNFRTYLTKIQEEFADEGFKQRQIVEEGFVSNLLDKTQILHGGKGLIKDDFDDVKYLIQPYLDDLDKIFVELKKAEQFKNTILLELRDNAAKTENWRNAPGENPAAPAEGAAPAGEASPEALDADNEVDKLNKDLFGE